VISFAVHSHAACPRSGTTSPLSLQFIQIIRPGLHHLLAFSYALGAVVGRAYLVAFAVRQLQLDDVRRKTLFV